mmetsp:Transcript_33316/g.80924  ORF Transcript_33316/g.80924 Transcript_33316/m.80924 type:complete len:84 (+) Transcript_33316:625-876(+)
MGRSNVGKSTLMNVITGRTGMCRVSKKPGCTKALHFYRLKGKFLLVDSPGYGKEMRRRERERKMMMIGRCPIHITNTQSALDC